MSEFSDENYRDYEMEIHEERMSSLAEIDRHEATWDSYKYPHQAWLSSPRDVWYANPHYKGEGWFYGTFYDNTHPEDDYGWEYRHYYYHDWKDMKFEDFTPVTKPKAVYVEDSVDPF